jgi:hypothetical protein
LFRQIKFFLNIPSTYVGDNGKNLLIAGNHKAKKSRIGFAQKVAIDQRRQRGEAKKLPVDTKTTRMGKVI